MSGEDIVGATERDLVALFTLESIPGMGPGKFRDLHMAGVAPRAVLTGEASLPGSGKRIEQLRVRIDALDAKARAEAETRASRQLAAALSQGGAILTYADRRYPARLLQSNYPVPVLYARGDLSVLSAQRSVACVGSRLIRQPYADRQHDFATCAAREHAVVSGFALGADTIAHRAAYSAGGSTIAVMAGGLDRPFPPENRSLWQELIDGPRAVFVSESGFGARASALTLRRRNKLIVALAAGVLVGQSSARGGAMNAYRFGLEQHKQVATFQADDAEDTSGNREIAQNSRAGGRTFPATHADPVAYNAWLHQLSSSI